MPIKVSADEILRDDYIVQIKSKAHLYFWKREIERKNCPNSTPSFRLSNMSEGIRLPILNGMDER
jgi:hypothetical protein